jgi:hypothetical protein
MPTDGGTHDHAEVAGKVKLPSFATYVAWFITGGLVGAGFSDPRHNASFVLFIVLIGGFGLLGWLTRKAANVE